MEPVKWIYEKLASRTFTLWILGILVVLAVPGTLKEGGGLYAPWLYGVVLFLLALNLAVCTTRSLKSMRRDVIVIHAGVMLTLAASFTSSVGSFVATKNIYVGTAVDSAYDWGKEEETPLGFTLRVEDLKVDYYPVEIKVGVKERSTGRKLSLFQLKTGERFDFSEYSVLAERMLPAGELRLEVFNGGEFLGTYSTLTGEGLPSDFPYEFVLVAYKNPMLIQCTARISVSNAGHMFEEGTVGVNNPFKYNGMRFYITNLDADRYGNPYVGFQIAKDPGRPVALLGSAVVTLGLLLFVRRRFFRRGR